MSGGITGPVSDHRRSCLLSRRDLIGAGVGALAGAVGARPALAQLATPAPDGPSLLAVPSTVGWDQPFSLYLSGAEPEARIAISSSVVVGIQAWGARAEYDTNAFGGIDFARDLPVAGDFDVADPMAFIWAASPLSRVERGDATDDELVLVASLEDDEITRIVIRRTLLPESYRPEHINTPERVGALYRPVERGDEPVPVIIRLGGSEGGVPLIDNIAPLLASHGHAVLSLAYFQAGDLPTTLEHIPLEYFGDTIEWLHEQDGIDPDRTGVFGTSRGGELALLLGAHFSAISSVVSVNGSGVVNRGIGPGFSHTDASAWSWQGRDLPYPEWEGTVDYTPPPETQIPVEQTNGPVLLVAGEADLLWPSTELSRYAWDRLRDADRPHPDQFLRFPGAGHAITAPYIPMSGSTFTPLPGAQVGGTVLDNQFASVNSWQAIIQHFATSLRPYT